MDRTMTYDEVKLAQRVLGIRARSSRATKNQWVCRMNRDREAVNGLMEKGHMTTAPEISGDWWLKLTSQGIQQLKQQMGEFTFR